MPIRPATRVFLLAATLLLSAEASRSAEPFTACLDPENPPLAVADGDRHGIYHDIAAAVAERLGRPFAVFWWPTELGKRALRLTLFEGRCDAAFGVPFRDGLMGPRLLVSGPLLDLGYALVVPEGREIRSVADLAGLRIAVVHGTEAQNALASRADVVPVTFRQPEEALEALARGEADAAFVWDAIAAWERQRLGADWRILRVEGPRLRWQSAVGVRREDRELGERLQQMLDGMRKDIDRIAADYGLRYDGTVEWPWLVENAETRGAAEPEAQLIPAAATVDAATLERGRKLFDATLGCAHCHGPSAQAPDRPRDLRLLRQRYGDGWEQTYWETVLNGRTQTVSGLVMPAWKDSASHEELEAIRLWLDSIQIRP